VSELQCAENAVAPVAPPVGYVSIYAKTDGQWYYKASDGTEKTLVGPTGGTTYDPMVFFIGKPTSSEVMLRQVIARIVGFPVNMTNSQASVGTAATAQTIYSLQKNSVEFGTITFAAASSIGTFSASTSTNFSVGDILTVVAPAVPDATMKDISITLVGDGAVGVYDISGGAIGLLPSNFSIIRHLIGRPMEFPASLPASIASAITSATAQVVLSIRRNSVVIWYNYY